jgi:hypothetical protein
MTEFQRQAEEATTSVAANSGLRLAFDAVSCNADPAVGHRAGDVYLRSQFRERGIEYEIFLYNDEAGVYVNRVWHAFERADWGDHASLVSGLCAFLKQQLMASPKSEQAS